MPSSSTDRSDPATTALASVKAFGHDRSVEKYFRKLHENRSPPGLERAIWRRLPMALLASVLLPAGMSIIVRLAPPQGSAYQVAKAINSVDIFAFATGLTALVAVLTVAIGCIVVMVMKGPAYVADGYDRLRHPESRN